MWTSMANYRNKFFSFLLANLMDILLINQFELFDSNIPMDLHGLVPECRHGASSDP